MINPYNIRNHWDKYRDKNGFPDVSLYGLRHTFVSVTKSTLPEALLKQTVGHSKSMDTLRVYGKEIPTDKIQTANYIDSIFSEYKTIAKTIAQRHSERTKSPLPK